MSNLDMTMSGSPDAAIVLQSTAACLAMYELYEDMVAKGFDGVEPTGDCDEVTVNILVDTLERLKPFTPGADQVIQNGNDEGIAAIYLACISGPPKIESLRKDAARIIAQAFNVEEDYPEVSAIVVDVDQITDILTAPQQDAEATDIDCSF